MVNACHARNTRSCAPGDCEAWFPSYPYMVFCRFTEYSMRHTEAVRRRINGVLFMYDML